MKQHVGVLGSKDLYLGETVPLAVVFKFDELSHMAGTSSVENECCLKTRY